MTVPELHIFLFPQGIIVGIYLMLFGVFGLWSAWCAKQCCRVGLGIAYTIGWMLIVFQFIYDIIIVSGFQFVADNADIAYLYEWEMKLDSFNYYKIKYD